MMNYKLSNLPEIDSVNWSAQTVEGVCNVCYRSALSFEPITETKASIVCDVCEVGICIIERVEEDERQF